MSILLGALVAFPAYLVSMLVGSAVFPQSAEYALWSGLGVFVLLSCAVAVLRRRQPSFWVTYLIAAVIIAVGFRFVPGVAAF